MNRITDVLQRFGKAKSADPVSHAVKQAHLAANRGYPDSTPRLLPAAMYKNVPVDDKQPFIFTCLHDGDHLDCSIRTYPSHQGTLTQLTQLTQLKSDDEQNLHDLFGAISYKGEGVFINQSEDVSPFISIFRYMPHAHAGEERRYDVTSKTEADFILERECKQLLESNLIKVVSDERVKLYAQGRITEYLIKPGSGGTNKIFYAGNRPSILTAMSLSTTGFHSQ